MTCLILKLTFAMLIKLKNYKNYKKSSLWNQEMEISFCKIFLNIMQRLIKMQWNYLLSVTQIVLHVKLLKTMIQLVLTVFL